MKITLMSTDHHFVRELEVEVPPRIGEVVEIEEPGGVDLLAYLVRGLAQVPSKGMILVYGEQIRRDSYPIKHQ